MEAKTIRQLSEEVDMLNHQASVLSDELIGLRREHRGDLDRIALELEILRRFLLDTHPERKSRFQEIDEEVRRDVSPE